MPFGTCEQARDRALDKGDMAKKKKKKKAGDV